MRFCRLDEVHVGAGVYVDDIAGLVGWQQQAVVAALVRKPRQELRLRVAVAVLQRRTFDRRRHCRTGILQKILLKTLFSSPSGPFVQSGHET